MQIQSEANVKRFNQALNELRNERPTDGMEAVLPSRGVVRRQTWWIAAGAAATVLVVAMLALPAKSEAVRLQDIGQAIEGAQIRHTLTYHVGMPEDGKLASETWAAGKWSRLEIQTGLGGKIWAVCDGTTRWTFNTYFKTMIVTKEKSVDYGADTLPKLLEAIKARVPGQKVELRETTRNGRSILELTQNSYFITDDKKQGMKRYPLKTVWTASADDKLPREVLHYQAKHSDDGSKIEMRLIGKGKIEYPAKLPDGIFDHSLPKGYKVAQYNTIRHRSTRC